VGLAAVYDHVVTRTVGVMNTDDRPEPAPKRMDWGGEDRKIRESQGLSQRRLAKLAAVDRASLLRYEKGDSRRNLDIMEKIAWSQRPPNMPRWPKSRRPSGLRVAPNLATLLREAPKSPKASCTDRRQGTLPTSGSQLGRERLGEADAFDPAHASMVSRLAQPTAFASRVMQ
jgi:DNA-binding XRE family transcriptional regulator